MEDRVSQDSYDGLIPPPTLSEPATPELSHARILDSNAVVAAASKNIVNRSENVPRNMTPPPSTQVPSSRSKTRTPTPPVSHISTPPPTVDISVPNHSHRMAGRIVHPMNAAELESASPEELRTKVTQLQAALQESNTAAAHHKLQYQMLSQESAAAIERMGVEARMAELENNVIHVAGQARVAATPQPSPALEGTIPVHKDLYQRICREIQQLRDANQAWKAESDDKEAFIERQECEIASLSDKVTLMRERIRDNREHLQHYRIHQSLSRLDATPRSTLSTPHRSQFSSQQQQHHRHHQQQQSQPFAALLQASEMASKESARSGSGRGLSGKKGHIRNVHSTSSLPTTPQRLHQQHVLPAPYQTPTRPQRQQSALKIPSTAPMPRTSAMRARDVYAYSSLPVSQQSSQRTAAAAAAALSDGTVSASEDEDRDNDSEAETDIIETDPVSESQASLTASQMLRSSPEQQQVKRDSFKGSGMLQTTSEDGSKLRQTKLFGAVRKAGVDRDDGPPAKRAKTGRGSGRSGGDGVSVVGLGISGVRD